MTDNQNLKNAEIAEIAKVIKPVMPYDGCGKDLHCHFKENDAIDCPECSIANALYNAGYRKSDEVGKEVAEAKELCRKKVGDLKINEWIKIMTLAGFEVNVTSWQDKVDEIRKEAAKEILMPLRKFLIEKFDYFGTLAKRNEEVNSDNRFFDLGEQDMANCILDRVNDLLKKYGIGVDE